MPDNEATSKKHSPRRRVLVNALSGTTQALVSGIMLFLLYRYLLRAVGSQQLGLWSLLTAILGLAQIADLGITGGVVKLTAQALATGDRQRAASLLGTGIVTVCLLTTIPTLVVMTLILSVVKIPGAGIHQAQMHALLPCVALASGLNVMGGVLRAGLDANNRVDLRQLVLALQPVLFLAAAWIMVPLYGLLGVVSAQAIASAIALGISASFLRRALPPGVRIVPVISFPHLRSLLAYGLPFQTTIITSFFCEPLTKWLLSTFAGLTAVTWFEMSSKLVQQCRALLVGAAESLVPFIAGVQHKPGATVSAYIESFTLMLVLSSGVFGCLLAVILPIAWLWIGHFNQVFILDCCLLAFGWWINALSAPSYFAGQGSGLQRWNVVSHIAIAVLNLLLGWIGGWLLGGVGVILGSVLSLCIGSVIQTIGFHRTHSIGYENLFPATRVAYSIGVLFISAIPATLFFFKIILQPPALVCLSVAGILCVAIASSFQPHFRLILLKSKTLIFKSAVLSGS